MKNKGAIFRLKTSLMILGQSLLLKSHGPYLNTIISESYISSFNQMHPEAMGNFLAVFHIERKISPYNPVLMLTMLNDVTHCEG